MRSRRGSLPAAFTLIELILVMALLVVAVAIVMPKMAGFFRGRVLDNEARRFMTLTRYAQNRAVSEGIPMLLWMDEEQRRYGLKAQPGFLEQEDDRAVEYTLADNLKMEVGQPRSTYQTTETLMTSRSLPSHQRFIRVGPDGFLGEQSPESVVIRRDDDVNAFLAMGPGRTWQSYDLLTNSSLALR